MEQNESLKYNSKSLFRISNNKKLYNRKTKEDLHKDIINKLYIAKSNLCKNDLVILWNLLDKYMHENNIY